MINSLFFQVYKFRHLEAAIEYSVKNSRSALNFEEWGFFMNWDLI